MAASASCTGAIHCKRCAIRNGSRVDGASGADTYLARPFSLGGRWKPLDGVDSRSLPLPLPLPRSMPTQAAREATQTKSSKPSQRRGERRRRRAPNRAHPLPGSSSANSSTRIDRKLFFRANISPNSDPRARRRFPSITACSADDAAAAAPSTAAPPSAASAASRRPRRARQRWIQARSIASTLCTWRTVGEGVCQLNVPVHHPTRGSRVYIYESRQGRPVVGPRVLRAGAPGYSR